MVIVIRRATMAAVLKSVEVGLKFADVLELKGTWEADESQRDAAWELYVELVTRVAVVELGQHEGLLREALASMHELFPLTRDTLKKYGPGVARPQRPGTLSLGMIAVDVLNCGLRPFLATWHPLLLDWEKKRDEAHTSAYEHERAWRYADEMRAQLRIRQGIMRQYAELLGTACDVPSLIMSKGGN
jgi:hypothetical protein